jgi:sec-independent protein translocase protein TatA
MIVEEDPGERPLERWKLKPWAPGRMPAAAGEEGVMFGLGLPELVVICVIALLVFGPKKLPDAGKALGQAIRGFRSGMEERDGAPGDIKAIPAPASCPTCGKSAAAGGAFCIYCGHPLAGAPRKQAA